MQEDPVRNAPIESLQLMLRTIALAAGESSPVIPDGIYGEATARAVSDFQSANSLPVTGIADAQTFRAIADAYDPAAELLETAQGPVVLFPAQLVILPGQYHPHVGLAQAMFAALRYDFPALQSHDTLGHLDSATQENFRLLQRQGALPETGSLDKPTWNRLCRLYRAMYDRDFPPSQG